MFFLLNMKYGENNNLLLSCKEVVLTSAEENGIDGHFVHIEENCCDYKCHNNHNLENNFFHQEVYPISNYCIKPPQ